MQKLITSTILIFINSVFNYPQWTNLNPVPNGNDLNSVFFIDDYTGWITGSDGFIINTTNSGSDWAQQNSGTTAFLKSVKFVNPGTGWVVGDSGTILKTIDGGMNWYPQSSGTSQNINDVHLYDSNIGWAVGDSGTILKTTNGGSNWSLYNAGDTVKLVSIDFIDAFIGWAVGYITTSSYGILLKTTDGGYNWLDISSAPINEVELYSVEFVNENIGWTGGKRGLRPFITTDGGFTWNYSSSPLSNIHGNMNNSNPLVQTTLIRDIFFLSQNVGYCIATILPQENAYILRTTDGGTNWEENPVPGVFRDLYSLSISASGKLYAVGIEGNIIISADAGESFTEYLDLLNSEHIINSVCFINENIGWSVGKLTNQNFLAGIILKTTDGGKYWATQQPTTYSNPLRVGNSRLNDIYFINQNTGWTIGNDNLIATTDGGQNWESRASFDEFENDFSSLIFVDTNTGWVVNLGIDVGIYKTTDGGYTWNLKYNQSVSSVHFVDANNGWAVGPNGIILKSTDGGETWNPKVSGTTVNLNKVKFFNSNVGVCVGDLGTTLFSTDGGESWISKSSGISENLSSVFISSLNSIWAAGDNGKILSTTDLGNTWTSFDGVTSDAIISLGFFNQYSGWVAGESIYKYFDESSYILPPVWSNQLNISDAGSIESTGILTFGQHSFATVGIDTALNEYELPPSPPAGIFDARFDLPVNPLVSSLTDFRDSTQKEITWTISFQPGSAGYPITFSWDSAGFPQGSFYLKDLVGGSYVFINMKNQSSYELTDQNITSLNISYKGNCSFVSVNDGWNMIAVPHKAENMSAVDLFPTASSSAFLFENGYIAEDTLSTGIGYWLKFDTNEVIQVCGSLAGDSVAVEEGWNLFGVYDHNISIDDITTTPPGIIATYFFGFEEGYYIADSLKTGKGYWVRVTENGVINLNSGSLGKGSPQEPLAKIKQDWAKIIITDSEGKNITLYVTEDELQSEFYQLPPIPPAGIFDVRYSSGKFVEDLSSIKEILISSDNYPVRIKAEGLSITVTDRINGKILNNVLKDGEELTITNNKITSIAVAGQIDGGLPISYQLYQNYPNPFNPSTTIKFGVSKESNVNLSIYNVLGELVSVIVDEEMKPGYYEYELNASSLASGVYLYRIQAGDPSKGSGEFFVETRKMILMK
jgi:photosystem II stability/assembly factor-like uncharacterized protein